MTQQVSSSDRNSSSRGAVLVVLAQGVQIGTQIVSLVVLSHLLPPRAFGVVAGVSALVGLIGVLSGFGLSLSALAGKTPTAVERSNLFWLNTAAGFVCMLVVAGCSPLVASFYRNPALVGITVVLSVPFLLSALTVQFKIELTLERRWTRLVLVQVVPGVTALTGAIVVAAITDSYWALVLQGVVSNAAALVLAVTLSGWRPMRPQRDANLGRHLGFGRDTAAIQLTNYVASNADSALVGRVLGRTALGEYNRAYNLVLMPLNQIAVPLEQVILPRLSAALDDGFEDAMVRCHRAMIYVQLVPISILAGTAHPLVRVFLGPHWARVPELMQIQAIGATAAASGYIFWWVLLVKRRTKILVLSEGVVEVLMVVAMALVVRTGSPSVAWCVAVGQIVILFSTSLLCRRMLSLELLPLMRVSAAAVGLMAVAGVCAALVSGASWWPNSAVALIAALLAWAVVCVFGWLVSRQVRYDISVVAGLLKSARR